MTCRRLAFESKQAASVSSFRDPRRKWFYIGRVVDLSFGYAHESRHGEMRRSVFLLLASLGLRRSLGETSSLYRVTHASQFRLKLALRMSSIVKTRSRFFIADAFATAAA
jgi:hypothetical protein